MAGVSIDGMAQEITKAVELEITEVRKATRTAVRKSGQVVVDALGHQLAVELVIPPAAVEFIAADGIPHLVLITQGRGAQGEELPGQLRLAVGQPGQVPLTAGAQPVLARVQHLPAKDALRREEQVQQHPQRPAHWLSSAGIGPCSFSNSRMHVWIR